MINPVQKLPHLNRREALQTVGATVALATAASGSLTRKGAHRRRMMVVSLHDRISGHAGRVRALDRFLTYGKGKKDLWFAPKDEIARYQGAKGSIRFPLDEPMPLDLITRIVDPGNWNQPPINAMAVGIMVNAAWGLGTGIGLALFGRSRVRT